MKFVSFEAANSNVKSKSEEKELVYVNTTRPIANFEEDLYGGSSTTHEINGRKYIVGETSSEADTSSSLSSARYGTEQYKIESLIAISQHVDDGDLVQVITGVPSKHYKLDNVHTTIEKQLLGIHCVNGKEFTIERCIIMLQPLGTLTYLCYNEDGTFKEGGRELAQSSSLLVIDLGWGTTDLAELKNKRLIKRDGFNVAMLHVFTRLKQEIEHFYPELQDANLTLFEYDRQLRKGNTLVYGNQTFDVETIKRDVFTQMAFSIMNRIESLGFALQNYERVIFTGGGTDLLAGYLRPFLSDVPNAIRTKQAQLANVRGYYIQLTNQ